MNKPKVTITYNSPVILTFTLISLAALIIGGITGGRSTTLLFSVYRSPLSDPLTYLRLFTHVLGHSGISHYMGNFTVILLVGPML
ncbi:MAG: rhomboid family intramembrane serine protease, partial [Ruminococcus sp.]|nr:rhomboid family intramembrane serine protease [Ruminococcus sp.]